MGHPSHHAAEPPVGSYATSSPRSELANTGLIYISGCSVAATMARLWCDTFYSQGVLVVRPLIRQVVGPNCRFICGATPFTARACSWCDL
ncbi:hypothetical protein J6590_029501 [Homalodisca vitripennis]|nr:hypothetical protein J6590_029501 [Homalodisca vitripennis]